MWIPPRRLRVPIYLRDVESRPASVLDPRPQIFPVVRLGVADDYVLSVSYSVGQAALWKLKG